MSNRAVKVISRRWVHWLTASILLWWSLAGIAQAQTRAHNTVEPGPGYTVDMDMRYSDMRAGPIGFHLVTVTLEGSLWLRPKLAVGALVSGAIGRNNTVVCCLPGFGNVAFMGRYRVLANRAMQLDITASGSLATASDSGQSGDSMALAASAHVADDIELFAPGTWAVRVGVVALRDFSWGSVQARALARQRFEPDDASTTAVSVDGLATIKVGRGIALGAGLLTTGLVYRTNDVSERFVHLGHIGASYSIAKVTLRGRFLIPIDDSLRARISRSVAVDMSFEL